MLLRPLPSPRGLLRRGRPPGVRTAKTTLAAVLAYVVAARLGTSAQPLLAPLTALLVVQLTLYETVFHGIGRVVSVLAGVLVAVGVASFVGLTWWSLGGVIAASLVLGRLLRLGEHLLEVPISAMLVLGVGGAETAAAGRVYETLVGAGVGVAVSALIAPPLYIQPAGDALRDLAERMAAFLSSLERQLRQGWTREAADHALDAARRLGEEVARADRAVTRSEQSARLNPRAVRSRALQPPLRTALVGLEHAYVSLRSLCRALLDRAYFVPAEERDGSYPQPARLVLADLLGAAGRAVEQVGLVTATLGTSAQAREEVEAHLRQMSAHRDRLAHLLTVDPTVDQGAWQQHGALLAAVDRFRVEIDAAVRLVPVELPPPLTARPGAAVRRAVRGRDRHR